MHKIYFIPVVLAVVLLFSCSYKQIGLKENWIDERDVIALRSEPVSQWMLKAGRPVIVELMGDTNIYYYNYRPTMYAAVLYGSDTSESKPALANATEVWGSRKNIIQIKAVNDIVISAVITDGPDKKTFIRDLNGDIILDTKSGFSANISEEQIINSSSKDFKKAFSSINGKNEWPPKEGPIVPIENAPEPIAEPMPEPVPEIISEVVPEESVPESPLESIPESVQESFPEPILEPVSEIVPEVVQEESVLESPQESISEPAQESVAE